MGNIPVIAVLATSYRTKEEMQAIIERKPHLQFLKSYGSYLAAEREDLRFNEFQAVWLASALLLILLCGIVAAVIAVHLHKKRHLMSSKTMQLHRYLMFHLITQVLAPALSVLLPIMILFSTRYFQVPFGAMFWNSVISQVVALHNPVNTITILFATRHYRAALFKPFKCIFHIAYGRKIASTVSSRRMNLTRAWQSNTGRFRSDSSN
ncbi:hypothetical protein GCK32_018793 [Trichostrongylus colubriformis]|uniref:G protein-coupled receptor n=1 Tax=Trichostrongylus colubriformis TaxID=6319 RepID=A0AAN8F4G7_TRICO